MPTGNLPVPVDAKAELAPTTSNDTRLSQTSGEDWREEIGQSQSPSPWRDPARLLIVTLAAFGAFAVVCFISFLFLVSQSRGTLFLVALFVLSGLVTVLLGYLLVQLLLAKNRAIVTKSVPLFFGLAQIVVWEQNEGLIFLRNKRLFEIIDGRRAGGGLRVIFPVLGEELRARVPLTVQLIQFQDNKVLTEEAIQLSVKAAIWWQVEKLDTYFYKLDREVHAGRDALVPGSVTVAPIARSANQGNREIAELWVQTLTESCLRKLIASTSTLRIVSNRTWSAIHTEMGTDLPTGPSASVGTSVEDAMPASPERIAQMLQKDLQCRLIDYGLSIDRVEIQEVQLPTSIQTAVDEVWVAATQPKKSGYEAQALENRLKVLCDRLGQNGATMTEVVQSLPSGSFLGNPMYGFRSLLSQLDKASGAGTSKGRQKQLPKGGENSSSDTVPKSKP
jgi:regulator of protease activity HflC (stomatin/prohibitin superfamily)